MKPKKQKNPNKLKIKIKNFFTIPDEIFEEEPSPKFEKQELFKINRNNLITTILVFLLITNILILFNLNQFYIRAILSFIFIITIPGLLIILMLKIREVGFWEYLVYTIGLSVSFIMFAGLAVNWILPWLNITDKPLSLYPILICFDIFLLVFSFIAWKRNRDLKFKLKILKLNLINRIFFIIPLFFPVLAILGAFLLNNHGTNILTMILLGSIAVYVLLITIFRKRLDENIYPWAILMISISVLLMSSLRSWYVSGVDTNTELSILNSIIKIQFWSPEIFKGAYGSMMSLTIFPSILHTFANINPHFVMKFLEVFIYALTPIIVYLLFKNQSKILSFFAGFFFMSTPIFIDWWPIPLRQQIAFLFFGLMLLLIFKENINLTIRKSLFIIFGFSMIVSHYSTTYIALAIFSLSYIFIFISIKYKNKKYKEKNKSNNKLKFLTLGIILLLLLFGFLWYNQSTNTSKGLEFFIKNSFSNLGNLFNEDLQAPGSSFIEQFSIKQKKSMPEILNEYIDNFENESKTNLPNKFRNINFNIRVPPGNKISGFGKLPFAMSIKPLFEVMTKILFVLGLIYFLFFMNKLNISTEKKNIILINYILIAGISILPLISINYDLSRTFAQSLFLSSFFSISFLNFLFYKFTNKWKTIFLVLFLILYFLIFSGFYMQLMGGSDIALNLNNKGLNYAKFYAHSSDISGADWLFTNNNNPNIVTDSHGRGKLKDSSKYKQSNNLPLISLKNNQKNIIYLRYPNIFFGIGTQVYKNIILYYSYPTKLLNKNKNKIYNNGGSITFK